MNRSGTQYENSDADKAAATESSSGDGTRSEVHRIPELDGLRGIAIGMVLVWHYFTTTTNAPYGSVLAYFKIATGITWSGVDLFFVLSGFLIGGILLDAR